MVLKAYSFEAGPQGSNATAGALGAAAWALNGGTATYDAAAAITGNFGLKLTSGTSPDGVTLRLNAAATSKNMAVAVGFTAPPTPAADRNIFNVNADPDSPVFRVSVNPSNHLVFDGRALMNFTDTGIVLTPGSKYRMEIVLSVGTINTNGSAKVNVYRGNDGVPLNGSLISVSPFQVGAVALAGVDVNISLTSAALSIDDVRFDDGATSFLGPAVDLATPGNLVRPKSLLANPGGFVAVGGTAGIAATLADESDASYAASPDGPAGSSMSVMLGPVTLGPVTVKVRHRASADTPAISRKYELVQGAAVIATRTVTLTPAWVDFSFTTTGGETAAIASPRNNLSLRVTDTTA